MLYRDDLDENAAVVDAVDDPELAATGRVATPEPLTPPGPPGECRATWHLIAEESGSVLVPELAGDR